MNGLEERETEYLNMASKCKGVKWLTLKSW